MSHFQSVTTDKEDRIVSLNHCQRATLNRQRNALVPAVNLPPEILTTIFEFAFCPDDDYWLANVNLKPLKNELTSSWVVTPLFVGAICSAWRSIAWGTPQLWTSIALLYTKDTAEKLPEMLDYWLSKSGELPLSVTLVGNGFHTVTYETFDVIKVIATYARRLHALDLYLPRRWGPEKFFARIASCTPLLTRLTISLCTLDEADGWYPTFTTFADAPQLREVTLSRISIAHVTLPWAQLESLIVDTGYNDVSKLVETLRVCPRLRLFSVYIGSLLWDAPPSISVRHTALEALEISGYYEKFHPELFKVLELPALRSFNLNISVFSPGPRAWSSWLPSLLLHVMDTLETLHVSPETPSDEELLTILRVVPRLRKLVLPSFRPIIYEEKLTQRTLDRMNPTKYEGWPLEGEDGGDGVGTTGLDERGIGHCLVPNLEIFEYQGKIDFTPHALVEFLVARWRHRYPPIRCTSFSVLDSPHRRLEGSGQHGILGPLPPNVESVRLRSVTFKTPTQIEFEGADAEVVEKLRLEGMHLEFLKCRS